MSSDISLITLIQIVEIAIATIVFLYAAHNAFTVRRGLVVQLYRSRALWVGTSAVLWAVFFIFFDNFTQIGTPSGVFGTYHVAAGLVFYAGVALPTLMVFLALIDRTNGTLIRLDYLRKDIIGWKKARPFFWLVVAIFDVFYVIDLGPAPGYGYYQSSVPHSVISFTSSYDLILLLIVFAYGLSVLVVGSIRTRDLTFRNYSRWLGLAIATLVLGLFASILSPVITYLFDIVFAYSWYRMARSLVPVNKLEEQRTSNE